MAVLNFIVKDLLGQNAVIVSLVALVGLICQKKSVGAVISGTMKTMLGFLVLLAGSGVIVATLNYLGAIFQAGFGLRGMVTDVVAISGIAQETLGGETALIMLLGFVVNIILARVTKLKYIFLTGQHSLWMATVCSVVGYMGGLRGAALIITGGLITGVLSVVMPAIAQPFTRKITGTDDIALGHFCTLGYMFEAGVAKVTGDKSKSCEDINLPKSLEFLQDTYLAMMVVMIPIYIIPAICAGPEFVANYSGGVNYVLYSFMQSIQFVVGVYILLAGVRLLLAEIVPAFRGIAMKIVPEAKPALDCPILFPYAPKSVIVGFITTTIGSLIGMVLFPQFGFAMILPGMLTNFFAGGAAGIFGNITGGRRGAIIGGIAHGLLITLMPALLVPLLGSFGLQNVTFSDTDVISVGVILGYVLKFLGLKP